MALNFDFNILAFFIFVDAGVFQCIDCHLFSTLYWNIQVSSQVMFSFNSVFFYLTTQENLSRSVDGRAFGQESFFFLVPTLQTFFMFNLSCKIFLTVSLSVFTVSAIIQMFIRRSLCTISPILIRHCLWS